MTREEIINKLKERREKGYTYKVMAYEAGLESPEQLYKFMKRDAPAYWVTQKLEAYLRRIGYDR